MLELETGAWSRCRSSPTSTADHVDPDGLSTSPDGSASTSSRRRRSVPGRPMRIDVFTIFPDMVDALRRREPARQGAGARPARRPDPRPARRTHRRAPHRRRLARSAGARAWCSSPSRSFAAVEAADPPRPLFLLGPGGDRLDQAMARELAADGRLLAAVRALRGRRPAGGRPTAATASCPIGDYVLAGGEVAAMVVLEAVGRLVPGVMGNADSADRGVVLVRPARVPAVHAAGRVRGRRGPRRAALGRPRPGRALAPRPGPGPHGPAPARPARRPPARRRRRAPCWPSSACSTRSTARSPRAVTPRLVRRRWSALLHCPVRWPGVSRPPAPCLHRRPITRTSP